MRDIGDRKGKDLVLGRGLLLGLLLALGEIGTAQAIPFVGEALSGRPCSAFERTTQGFGPFDYRQYSKDDHQLKVVEKGHFKPRIKNLKGTMNTPTPAGDLNYVLRAFPNHHQALYSIIRFYTGVAQAEWDTDPQNITYPPPECYLQRAIAYQPDDVTLQFLYGLYLHRLGHLAKAQEKYEKGLDKAPNYAEGHYNFGLLLVDREKYQKAREQARKAYNLGFPLPGLKQKLEKAGYPLSE